MQATNTGWWRWWLVVLVAVGGGLMAWSRGQAATGAATAPAGQRAPLLTPTLGPTTTPTQCPQATPEIVRVDPVTSPTAALTQTITVYTGNAVTVTVTINGSDVYSTTGTFDGFANPARITIPLQPNTTHNLLVRSYIRQINQGGCLYGGYSLSTGTDHTGQPLQIVQQSVSTATPTPTPTTTPTGTATPTGTPCPQGTPEPLWVDPVTSPTGALTQTITVYAGNALTVTVTINGADVYTATGSFGASFNPARITIPLQPNGTHNLLVRSYTRQIVQGGCVAGGYVLSTTHDRQGQPLVIVQQSVGNGTPTSTPTARNATATPTPTPSNGTPTTTATAGTVTATPTPTANDGTVTPTPTANDGTVTPTPTASNTTPTATPTMLPCPVPTQEPLWVDPVTSPTNALTQTITVYAGNALTVTVRLSPTEAYSVTGSFDAFANPARITIPLQPNTTYDLLVSAEIRRVVLNGCVYGGYTRSTDRDRQGQPLQIVQQAAPRWRLFLPLALRY